MIDRAAATADAGVGWFLAGACIGVATVAALARAVWDVARWAR